jgi:DNA-binding response OmpR family regulator
MIAPPIKHASLDDEQLRQVRDRLDSKHTSKARRNRRAHPQVTYKRDTIPVRIVHAGGHVTSAMMASQNISAGGILLLHSRFLHLGTECHITLQRRLGGEDVITGKVAWCQLLVGVAHAIGIKFQTQIFVKHYLQPDECKKLLEEPTGSASDLKGKVMLVEASAIDRMLFTHCLKQTACEIITAATGAEAIEKCRTQNPQVVLCSLDLPDMTGDHIIQKMRKDGFTGCIAVLTAETDPARLKAAMTAGSNEMVLKPYEAETLLARLSAMMQSSSPRPIHSTLADRPEIMALIPEFIQHARITAASIHAAVAADKLVEVRSLCLGLKGTGAGYGFALLSEAANDAVKSMDASQSVAESKVEIDLVLSICQRVTAAPEEG